MAALTPIAERAVVAARGPRAARDPTRPYAHFVERERSADGRVEDVAAVFLTNKECPFRCLVCDLWKNATPERVPDGAVAGQVAWALARLRETPHVKLYNGGSFFDAQAIPEPDVARIAALLPGKRSVIVECHPKLVDERCLVFAEAIAPARLELAMGLETVDPDVLPFIKPDMSLDHFAGAARFLIDRDIAVRVPHRERHRGARLRAAGPAGSARRRARALGPALARLRLLAGRRVLRGDPGAPGQRHRGCAGAAGAVRETDAGGAAGGGGVRRRPAARASVRGPVGRGALPRLPALRPCAGRGPRADEPHTTPGAADRVLLYGYELTQRGRC
jgi:hypothetical protein